MNFMKKMRWLSWTSMSIKIAKIFFNQNYISFSFSLLLFITTYQTGCNYHILSGPPLFLICVPNSNETNKLNRREYHLLNIFIHQYLNIKENTVNIYPTYQTIDWTLWKQFTKMIWSLGHEVLHYEFTNYWETLFREIISLDRFISDKI